MTLTKIVRTTLKAGYRSFVSVFSFADRRFLDPKVPLSRLVSHGKEEKSRRPQHLEGSRHRMKAGRCYRRPDFFCFGKKQAKPAARIVVV
jgi:hypothetical protein